MNELLQLKGRFEQKARNTTLGNPNLPTNGVLNVEHLRELKSELEYLLEYWKGNTVINGALISVFYTDIIPKSRRITGTFANGNIHSNDSVVGAKFIDDGKTKHVITHYISLELLKKTIGLYELAIDALTILFKGVVSYTDIDKMNKKIIPYDYDGLTKTKFLNIIIDAYYVEKFGINVPEYNKKENSIITIYQTDIPTGLLMDRLGIKLPPTRIIDQTTMLLTPDQIGILFDKAPYLVSMSVTDLSKFDDIELKFTQTNNTIASIPSPNTEPVIGVIDTLFDNRVYFSEWVEYKDMVSADIPKKQSDYEHGTAVSSIIVDGPTFNPELDDGCGRFRVRHFGVATGGSFSSFSILRAIKEIVAANKDIKVWNLSLGSQLEINENFISPEAAILDSIQAENDIIFIIAGTNKIDPKSKNVLIGAPADSINSLVVNAVTPKNLPTDYSRRGPVLSFFMKPDVSYYGGTDDNRIRVCTPTGEKLVQGTSFAAPWIARKMAYLIHVAGLTREVAKALIIDAATGWKKETDTTEYIGHGVVPVKINDIVQSPKDEIKFFLSGKSEKYDTYNYNIPVPISNEKHPFIAKATLCYFPACSRNQGVDYTNTELDILFGRIGNDNAIKPINNNYQSEVGHFMYEKEARKYYRKWDNIKHIRETENKNKPKKIYTGMWGISIKTKERLEQKFGEDLKFGVVITLKAIDGVNRIEDFIQQCSLRGWLVNRINIENKIDIYNAAEAHVDFS